MHASSLSEKEYNSYYQRYIDQASGMPLQEGLAEGLLETSKFFESIPKDKLEFRYASGKWTPKEILLHLIDTERVFAYRALHFARADNVTIRGFEQDEFAANSHANERSLEDLLQEYLAVRTASIVLFKSFAPNILLRKGMASDAILSVRAAGFIICGHEKHHMDIIRERYL